MWRIGKGHSLHRFFERIGANMQKQIEIIMTMSVTVAPDPLRVTVAARRQVQLL